MNEMQRKWLLILPVFIVFLILSPCGTIIAEEATTKEGGNTFVFPFSITAIEDEAFEGTAVKVVVLPDGLLNIGAKAFENARFLTDVYIPDTTEHIADSGFFITSDLTIHGIDSSYAKDWAHQHEIPFVIDDIWNVFVLSGRSNKSQTNPVFRLIAAITLAIVSLFFGSRSVELRSRRPQDRPELNPIDYNFP